MIPEENKRQDFKDKYTKQVIKNHQARKELVASSHRSEEKEEKKVKKEPVTERKGEGKAIFNLINKERKSRPKEEHKFIALDEEKYENHLKELDEVHMFVKSEMELDHQFNTQTRYVLSITLIKQNNPTSQPNDSWKRQLSNSDPLPTPIQIPNKPHKSKR